MSNPEHAIGNCGSNPTAHIGQAAARPQCTAPFRSLRGRFRTSRSDSVEIFGRKQPIEVLHYFDQNVQGRRVCSYARVTGSMADTLWTYLSGGSMPKACLQLAHNLVSNDSPDHLSSSASV